MSRRTVCNFSTEAMGFALLENDCGLDLEEVGADVKNLTLALRVAIRRTYATETDHTLYVLVNGRKWLPDPLKIIKEAVESEEGTIKNFDLSKRKVSVYTKDEHQLDIVIIGKDKPEEDEDEEEPTVKQEVLDVKKEVIEILDTDDEKEVVEILDTSAEECTVEGNDGEASEESDSDYEDFNDTGLTQFVCSVGRFQLP
jgi:hypothetical protein